MNAKAILFVWPMLAGMLAVVIFVAAMLVVSIQVGM